MKLIHKILTAFFVMCVFGSFAHAEDFCSLGIYDCDNHVFLTDVDLAGNKIIDGEEFSFYYDQSGTKAVMETDRSFSGINLLNHGGTSDLFMTRDTPATNGEKLISQWVAESRNQYGWLSRFTQVRGYQDYGLPSSLNGKIVLSTMVDGSMTNQMELGGQDNKVKVLENAEFAKSANIREIMQLEPNSQAPSACTSGMLGGIYVDSELKAPCFCNGNEWVLISDLTTSCEDAESTSYASAEAKPKKTKKTKATEIAEKTAPLQKEDVAEPVPAVEVQEEPAIEIIEEPIVTETLEKKVTVKPVANTVKKVVEKIKTLAEAKAKNRAFPITKATIKK